MEASDHRDLLLEDYRLGVGYLTNQFTRMWTRFNFFLTLEAGLAIALVGLFKGERLSAAALVIPGVALLISLCWYVTGAQDRYLVEVYRKQIGHTVRRLVPDEWERWPYVGCGIAELEPLVGQIQTHVYQFRWEPISITKLAAWFPLLTALLWLIALIGILTAQVGGG